MSAPHIVILGSGFAALTAVRELRRRDRNVRITLVAPKAELMYYPSLIWVPAGLRRGEDLCINVSGFLAEHDVTFHAGRVTGLADGGRTVLTDHGTLTNDALLIASGGRFLKSLPGIEHALTICEGAPAAEAIRERLAGMSGGTLAFGFGTNPKEQGAMRGGPMFELLFGIDTLLRKQGRRESFKLVFFNAAKEPGKRLGRGWARRFVEYDNSTPQAGLHAPCKPGCASSRIRALILSGARSALKPAALA